MVRVGFAPSRIGSLPNALSGLTAHLSHAPSAWRSAKQLSVVQVHLPNSRYKSFINCVSSAEMMAALFRQVLADFNRLS